uniref:MFS transporter n=1 Tax=Cyberlindnera americana TaxID=36016 RepID=A0A5P8N982_9ASCO|nr:MFS transporter [Cyberlindnera americana]
MEFDEKPETAYIDSVESVAPTIDFSDIDEKAVMRKIDYHLMPICAILYLFAYLDRGAIGNAKIEGLLDSLDLSTQQYNICLTIFFITYSSLEMPANMILKKIGKPNVFIPSIMVCWGIIMTCMGVVKSFGGLFATRFLLGVFECGLYPGISYTLTMYYKKKQLQSRQAIFYAAASMAGAFSGLLAFAIAKMSGVGGYEGWRWIFILEGIATTLLAISAFWLLPDFPERAKFLTLREREFIVWRIATDSNAGNQLVQSLEDAGVKKAPDFSQFTDDDDISLTESLKRFLTDWQAYTCVLFNMGLMASTYGIALFLPSVVKGLGYTSSKAQLMTIPIYIAASIFSVAQAFLSDHHGYRSPFLIFDFSIVMIGFIMAICGEIYSLPGVIYAGVFLSVMCSYAAFPGGVSWLANNLANNGKRAIGIGFHIGIGNFGGAMASNFYKPGKYTMGHSLELGFATMGLICVIITVLGYRYNNTKRENELKSGKWDDATDKELFMMGDKSPYYRYRL